MIKLKTNPLLAMVILLSSCIAISCFIFSLTRGSFTIDQITKDTPSLIAFVLCIIFANLAGFTYKSLR